MYISYKFILFIFCLTIASFFYLFRKLIIVFFNQKNRTIPILQIFENNFPQSRRNGTARHTCQLGQ